MLFLVILYCHMTVYIITALTLLLLTDTTKQGSKMAKCTHVFPALTRLPDLQEQTLVDASVHLEYREGFALGMIKGTEQLCLLCPQCRIPTAVVSAWMRCSHCGKTLTQLASR